MASNLQFCFSRMASYQEWRSNKFKTDREVWCVNQFCKLEGIENPEVEQWPDQQDSVDILLAINGARFKFQVVEIAPLNKEIKNRFDDRNEVGYGNLHKEVRDSVNEAIRNKEQKDM